MSFGMIVTTAVAVFFVLMVGTRLLLWARARALRGKPVPTLSGDLGDRLRESGRGLVYFFTPSCGACRPWTPRMRELASKSRDVHVVDAVQDITLSRAFGIMATPCTIEIEDGKVVNVHVGGIPQSVLSRFAEVDNARGVGS